MSDSLNNRRLGGDLSDPAGRYANILGQLEQLLRSNADAHTANQAQVWARQGLDLIATLDCLNAADPDVPAQREADVDALASIDVYEAERDASWGL
jgi:hypothetical protein